MVPRTFGDESVADGRMIETSQQSRATNVASDSALALASREIFPDLRQGVPEDVEIAGHPSSGVAKPRTPGTVVEVFPMTDDAPAEIPQRTSTVQDVGVGSAPPGGTPVSSRTGIRTAQTVCQVQSLEK